jgi:hypothetical protein
MQQMMRSMDLVPFLFINGFLLAIAGVIIAAVLHARRRSALVKSMPTSNIGMAADGSQVIAPHTQTPCAWYRAKLENWVRSTGNRSGSWQTVRESTSSSPLLLRDTTGACIVFPFRAEVTPTDKSQWTGASAEPTDRNPPRLGPTESTSTGVEVAGGSSSRFRYSEERIYVGDPLFVLGEFIARMADEDEDEDDEAIDDDLAAGDEQDGEDDRELDADAEDDDEDDGAGPEWDDSSQSEELTKRAQQITRAFIARGTGARPFIMSTTPQATHVSMSDVGSQAALYLAALPLGLMAMLLYARYG